VKPIEEETMKRGCGQSVLILGLVLILAGCAGGISKEAQSQISYFGPFDQVQKAPERYQGETVMWGGKVITTKAKNDTTEIIVLQLGLGNQHRPQDNDKSQGRFIIHSSQFLDPAIYPKGTLVTVVGSVTGTALRSIGEMQYRYPVIDVAEIKKWKPGEDASPRIHFGIGIGTHF
jgi:outer membrane lipoprotein